MGTIAPGDWPRLLALLDDALDTPADARTAWLHGLALPPAQHTALQGLLAQREQLDAQDFMATLPPIAVARSAAGSPFVSGAQVGPWRLVRALGQGGMNVVWLAQREDGQLQRPVALKMPHAGPGQDLLAQRMLRERRILAALEHPNIARLYDVGLTEAGTPYLVMEYVPGDNLLAHADQAQLTVPQRVQLFLQVLAAVQYAHSRLILHRDLKPPNILVSPAGQVKLLDFGIAKVMAKAGETGTDADAELTQRSGRQLTPRYASPEQLLGQEPGITSDVYALGVVLYELLCGRHPHDGGATSAVQFEAAVLHDDPRPPSRQTPLARQARQLRSGLDAVVLKALAKTPDQRYATADALATDLQRWLAGLPVLAQAPGLADHLGKFMRRHRVGVAMASLATVALLGAGTLAVLQGLAARQQADRAGAARDFLLELFAESSPERLAGAQLTATEVLERGRLKAQTSLRGQPLLQAELLAGIGDTQLQTRNMVGADAALAIAAENFKALGEPAQEAAARLGRLDIASQDGHPQRVPGLLAELQPLVAVLAADRLLHMRWLMLSGLAALSTHSDAGLALLAQSLALADARIPAQAAIALRTHMLLARQMAARGEATRAEAHLAAAEALPLPGSPYGLADRAAALADVRASLAMFSDGFSTVLSWLPAQVADCDAGLGPGSPRCAELRQLRLWALLRMGDGRQALALAEELLPLLIRSRSQQARFAAAYLWVRILAANGRTDRLHPAVASLEDLVAAERTDPLMPSNALPALAALATLQLRAGDLAGAAQWVAQADAITAALGPGVLDPQRGAVEQARGLLLQARGAHPQALKALGCEAAQPVNVGQALSSLNCVPSWLATGQQTHALLRLGTAVATLERTLGPQAPASQRSRALLKQLQVPAYRQPAWSGAQVFLSGIR
ncbi:MAG: serine/threonine protein kinase [Rubrivivax sp.]|nr:serine/threonine protein kinase [Rubrivivax sp.]